MKTKYDLAIKYYTETENFEQIKIAYFELEQFNQTFENFFYYIELENKTFESLVKNSYESIYEGYIKNKENKRKNSGHSGEIKQDSKITLPLEQFSKIIHLTQLKIADTVFNEANFNSELLNHIKKKEKVHNGPKKEHEEKDEKKNSKEEFSTQISCLILFMLLFFSFLVIYIQSYFYDLNLAEQLKTSPQAFGSLTITKERLY